MSMTPKTHFRTAILATAVLALAAIAPMVEAKDPADRPDRPDRGGPGHERTADDHRGPRGTGNATAHERMANEHHRQCAEPANESVEKRCKQLKERMDKEHKARRHAHALLGAIAAHERILGRVEYKISKTEARLAEGNLTGNQTEALEMRIEKLEAMKERQIEKIDELTAKLEQLKARWEAARERAEERRAESGGEEEGEEESSSSSSAAP